MPLITPNIEKIDPFYRDETPEEGKDMQRFFMSTYLMTGALLFATAGFYYFLLHWHEMQQHVFPGGKSPHLEFHMWHLFLLFALLVTVPLYHSMAFFRSSPVWLIIMALLYPFIIGYYAAVVSSMLEGDVLGGPLISSGSCFIICAAIGIGVDKFFYLRIIPYLKFFIGLCLMFTLHETMTSTISSWFFGVVIFWVFDFIASDSKKLYHIPRIKNPPLTNLQQLLIASISIVMIIGLQGKGGGYTLLEGRLNPKDRMK